MTKSIAVSTAALMLFGLSVAAMIGAPIASAMPIQFITMDFAPATLPGGIRRETSMTEDGFVVNGSFGSVSKDATVSRLFGFFSPDNGTDHMRLLGGDSAVYSQVGGGGFAAIQVDLAEYTTVTLATQNINFVFEGRRLDGSVVTQTFVLDRILDGPGGLPDFETFYFDDRFIDLAEIELLTFASSVDNFVFAVPEPRSGLLLMVGLSLLAAPRRTPMA